MSGLFLHIGQCGNQLGEAFWREVHDWYPETSSKDGQSRGVDPTQGRAAKTSHLPFSLLEGTLPCILIDTEPKVIKRCSRSGVLSKLVPPEFRVSEKRGRGNNWAYGYFGRQQNSSGSPDGGRLVEVVQECVRRLVERCDRFMGTVLLHSIAGGTGAGLSSAILECLRDDYPLAYLLSLPVAPFSSGESPLQHYNSLLCLSWLQTYCDAVLLFQNDFVLEQAQKCALRERGSKCHSDSVSVDDMNRHISHTLCNCLLPVWTARQRPSAHSCMEPWELVRSLCPDPSLKFITPVHAQFSKGGSTWDQALSCLTHASALQRRVDSTHTSTKGKHSTVSLVQISRSSPANVESLIRSVNTTERKLKMAYNTVAWNPFPVDFWFSHEPRLRERKLASVLANSSVVADYIESVYRRAMVMYREGAYLHWYEKYGCEKELFEESFTTVENIIDSYVKLKS